MRVRIKTIMIVTATLAVVLGIIRWLWRIDPYLAGLCVLFAPIALAGCLPFAVAYRFHRRDRR